MRIRLFRISLCLMIVGVIIAFVRENLVVRTYLNQDFHSSMPFAFSAGSNVVLLISTLIAACLALHAIIEALNPTYTLQLFFRPSNALRVVIGGIIIGAIYVVCVVAPVRSVVHGSISRWWLLLLPQIDGGLPYTVALYLVLGAAIGGAFLFVWFTREGLFGDPSKASWKYHGSINALVRLGGRGALAGALTGIFIILWYVTETFFNNLFLRTDFAPSWYHFLWLSLSAVLASIAGGTLMLVFAGETFDYLTRLRGGAIPLLILSIYVGAGISAHEYVTSILDFGKDPCQFIMTREVEPKSNTVIVFGRSRFVIRRATNRFPHDIWTGRASAHVLTLIPENSEMAMLYLEQKDYKSSLRWPLLVYQVMESDYLWKFDNSLEVYKTYMRRAKCTFCIAQMASRIAVHTPDRTTRAAADYISESRLFIPTVAAHRRIGAIYLHLGDAEKARDWFAHSSKSNLKHEFDTAETTLPPVALGGGTLHGCFTLDDLPLPGFPVALAVTDDPRLLFIDGAFNGRYFVSVTQTNGDGCFHFANLTDDNPMYLVLRDPEDYLPESAKSVNVLNNPGRIRLSRNNMKIELGVIRLMVSNR